VAAARPPETLGVSCDAPGACEFGDRDAFQAGHLNGAPWLFQLAADISVEHADRLASYHDQHAFGQFLWARQVSQQRGLCGALAFHMVQPVNKDDRSLSVLSVAVAELPQQSL
jgi:hypothetical protein